MLTSDKPLGNFLFEYRGADLILRSHDSHHFQVPKVYIINSSPVLEELIQRALDDPNDTHGSLLIVQLPESGAILHNLLTFIFPVTPLTPPTTEEAMELLSVAQKYQMVSVLAHIRDRVARHWQNPSSTQLDAALHHYSLAQKYGLRQEALHAAQIIFKYPMTIEDKLDMVPGASLYELWNYYEKFRAILKLDLTEFKKSGARGTLNGLNCVEFSSSQIPRWLDKYIKSITSAPNLFDLIEFNTVLARHINDVSQDHRCKCVSIPSRTIRSFWEALTSVVYGSFEKVSIAGVDELLMRLKSLQAESALSLVQDREDSQAQVNSTTSPEPLDVPDANVIVRSSDLVDFRVHKPVLAIASPFFKDLLSLPQSSDSESVDGLPVVQLSEDAELLHTLVSLLYPVRPVVPKSYDKVLYLLAACQKYDMVQAQSYIRTEVDRGCFPSPVGTEVFRAHAIASSNGLIPETERAARLTLSHPMTFESLGEGLRLYDGSALRELARFRKRCAEILVTCIESFLEVHAPGPSNIWVGCPDVMPSRPSSRRHPPQSDALPSWLRQVLSQNNDNLTLKVFTHPLPTPSKIRGEYLSAIQSHAGCNFCSQVHAKLGPTFCMELESKLEQARAKVRIFHFLISEYLKIHTPSTPRCVRVTRGYPQTQLSQVLGIDNTPEAAPEAAAEVDIDPSPGAVPQAAIDPAPEAIVSSPPQASLNPAQEEPW